MGGSIMADQTQTNDYNPWSSRKLWVSIITTILVFGGPILYKCLGISDQVSLVVIGAISTISAAYLGFNVLQKKIEGPNG
jgi:hypothetical protein